METEREESDIDSMPPLEEIDENAIHGEILVTRRALSTQVKEESNAQRENLFHTRCLVNGKICCVVIDGKVVVQMWQVLLRWKNWNCLPPNIHSRFVCNG